MLIVGLRLLKNIFLTANTIHKLCIRWWNRSFFWNQYHLKHWHPKVKSQPLDIKWVRSGSLLCFQLMKNFVHHKFYSKFWYFSLINHKNLGALKCKHFFNLQKLEEGMDGGWKLKCFRLVWQHLRTQIAKKLQKCQQKKRKSDILPRNCWNETMVYSSLYHCILTT